MNTYQLPDGLGGTIEFITLEVNENEFISMPKSVYDEQQAQQNQYQGVTTND